MRFSSFAPASYKRNLAFIAALSAFSAQALAADLKSTPAPSFKVGDTWVFDQTIEKGQTGFSQVRIDLAIERLNDSTMMVGIKRDGAPTAFEDHVVGKDWSLREVIDGQETATTRPFTFPMSVGDSWTIDYTDSIRRGAQTSLHVHQTYKVVGWEDVTVPAGTYRALKIEANGVDNGTIQTPAAAVGGAVAGAGGATTIMHTQRGGQSVLTRKSYDEIYYVPELNSQVKSVEEQYNSEDVRVSRQTRVMVAYKKAPG